jgi:hypothetical protein
LGGGVTVKDAPLLAKPLTDTAALPVRRYCLPL